MDDADVLVGTAATACGEGGSVLTEQVEHARVNLDEAFFLVGGSRLGHLWPPSVHQLCIEGPAFDQVTTLSKFLCMGVDLPTVIKLSTENAGLALKRPELGTLKPGCPGDATLLKISEGRFDYVDVMGEVMTGEKRIEAAGTVIAGRWWHPA